MINLVSPRLSVKLRGRGRQCEGRITERNMIKLLTKIIFFTDMAFCSIVIADSVGLIPVDFGLIEIIVIFGVFVIRTMCSHERHLLRKDEQTKRSVKI